MSRKRSRVGDRYVSAPASVLASAGGYRGFLGTAYTRDTIAAKGGTSGFVDLAVAQNVSNDANMVTLAATIAQGTSTQQRIGRKITLNSVQIRGYVRASTATGADRTQNAIFLVYDKRPTGTLPAITDIVESAAPTALNKEDGFDRFRIIKRWDFAILGNEYAPDTGSINAKSNYQMNKFVRLGGKKGLKSAYKTDTAGDNGTIDGFQEGSLLLCVLGDQTNAGGSAPYTIMSVRVRFTDVLS